MSAAGRIDKPVKGEKLSKSCDYCKSKKTKCNHAMPCANCTKHNVKCVYSVMKKPGLKPGYGRQVFEKIEALDHLIEEYQKQRQTQDSVLKEKVGMLEKKLELLEKRSSEKAPVHEANIAEPFFHKENLIDYDFTPPESIRSSLSSIHTEDLPNQDQINVLVDKYFEFFHPVFPVLHPIFERQQASTTENLVLQAIIYCSLAFADDILTVHEIKYYEACLKTRIIANCFAVRTKDQLKAIALLAFALYSKSNDYEAWSVISLAATGCMHLGLTKESFEPDLMTSLSKPETTEEELQQAEWEKWVQKESSRRLVFEIYQLDKLSSLASFTNCKMPQASVRCYLPVKQDFWENRGGYQKQIVENGQKRKLSHSKEASGGDPTLYGSSSHVIEVIRLMSDIQSSLQEPPAIKDIKSVLAWQLRCYDLETKIASWKSTLDDSTSTFLDNEGKMETLAIKDILLYCLYHTMIIRLNSTAAFPYFQDKVLLSSQTAREKCLQSAEAIVRFSRSLPSYFDQNKSIYETFGPYYAFSLWVSGRVLLVDTLHSEGCLSKEFDFVITALQTVGKNWKCALKYADILEFFKNDAMTIDTLSQEDVSVIEQELGSDMHPGQSEDTQLISDMRLNASSLDQLLSDKIAKYKNVKGEIDDLSMFDWFKLPTAFASPVVGSS